MKFSHILLTSDLSDEALRAFGPVAELTRNSGAKITLLHIVHGHTGIPHGAALAPPVADPALDDLVEAARKRLTAQAQALGDGLDITIEVGLGDDIGKAVAKHAQQLGADLIALSTHGRTGFRRLVLGSVADEILRHAPCPVLAFPQADD